MARFAEIFIFFPPTPVSSLSFRSKAVVPLLLIHCFMFLTLFRCAVLVSSLVLKSSLRGRESWLLYFVCLPGVL